MIYPLNEMIEQLLLSAVDEETGEMLLTEEELAEKLDEIQTSFDEKIDSLASMVKNLKAEAEAIKAEKKNLADRQSMAEKQMERTKRFLAWLLKGEKFKNGRHSISYRKSESVILDDSFMEWAEVNAPGLLVTKIEPSKEEIKKAIKGGASFEHAHLEEKNNIQIK